MDKPLIGIVGKPENSSKRLTYIVVNNEIKEAIVKNGGIPIGILPLDTKYSKIGGFNEYTLTDEEISKLNSLLNKVDGIVMQGGFVSNSYEIEIIKICLNKNIPILGICSGFNNIIRAQGGKLELEKNNIHNKYDESYVHNVVLNKSSKLYSILKKDKILVNSIHKLVAYENDIINCEISAICEEDNTVEAIEVSNAKFAIGVKWHPELLPEMNNLFKSFVDSCKK